MRRRRFRAVVPVAVLTLTGLFGFQEASYASAPTPQTITLTVGGTPTGVGAVLDRWWQVGDCWMEPGSYVEVTDGKNLHLHGITYTDHTNHADIWHNRIRYKDFSGSLLVWTDGHPLDSSPMTPKEGDSGPSDEITWDRYLTVPSLPPLVLEGRAATVEWTGSC
jgi:hypothetical protein